MVLITGILALVLGIIGIKWAFNDGEEWGALLGIVFCFAGVGLILYGLSPLFSLIK